MKKKLLILVCTLLVVLSAGCGKSPKPATPPEDASGINAEVVQQIENDHNNVSFDGYLTTSVPVDITAAENSINGDFAIFSFSRDNNIIFDVSFNVNGTSPEQVEAQAKEIAKGTGCANASSVKIDGVSFIGVEMQIYGKNQYMAHINGWDVIVSVYCDVADDAVKEFFKNTQWSIKE